jgi:preprotein translocase subunit SecF
VQVVGPTWGAEITAKGIQALIVFLILVTIFLAIYFEWRFAVAALVALAHDIILTVGIYAITGLPVTPATLIGFLTILGYSLYDTVVVFDKVKEDTKGITAQSVMTYPEAANRSVNQVLVRSINTTITSLLPVLAIIVVGAGLLGAGTLLDLAVALGVGMFVGVYSSLFIATPVAVMLKMRQPDIKALDNRVAARRAGAGKRATESQEAAAAAVGVVDTQAGSLTALGAAERLQPKRQPRSKRGKK